MQQSEVGDTADIQNRHWLFIAPEKLRMKRWDQWRSLTPGRNIAATEVRDHLNAAQLCQQRGLVYLQRVADSIKLTGSMPNRLSMRTYGSYILGCNIGFIE